VGRSSTLELQQLLVEQGATAPLLLIYSARPEFRAAVVAAIPPQATSTSTGFNAATRESS